MANKAIFKSAAPGKPVPVADTTNRAGGLAYEYGPEHKLAQLATVGTFNDTFYGTGKDQLDAIRQAADGCTPEFIAQTAIYARERGFMKDMPAALLAMLTKADPALVDRVFDRVIDNGKMLRNFVQMVRSGQFGRKSLGSGPKRLVQRKLAAMSDNQVFRASVGNDPSLADVIKLVHPQPTTESRKALYGYLLGREHDATKLPELVQHYEAFKRGDRSKGVPAVDFRMLTSLSLTKDDWKAIALNGGWHQTRMNLNTYTRHGVLGDIETEIAAKLRNPDDVRKAKVFPYQLLVAFQHATCGRVIQGALQDAMEVATENVPSFGGRVVVIVDVSGSMRSASVTGNREGATSVVRVIDAAALAAATIVRRNPLAEILPVDTRVHSTSDINPRDSIMTIADRLRRYGGGGTTLSAAMHEIEANKKATPDLIVMLSDNESWVDSAGRCRNSGTAVMESFRRLQARNQKLKMVCVDMAPYGTTQATGDANILNVGGFSDEVFNVIDRFVRGDGPRQWVEQIKAISLDGTPTQANEPDATGLDG